MSYNGLEVDMLNVGDADCILVTRWDNGVPTYVLIDGAYAKDYDAVSRFLTSRSVTVLHHVLCSHPHDDHISGITELLKRRDFAVKRLWMHQPWKHVDYKIMQRVWQEKGAEHIKTLLRKSFDAQVELANLAVKMKIAIDQEPFEKASIGPLAVCSPSEPFYRDLLLEFGSADNLAGFETAYEERIRQDRIAAAVSGQRIGGEAPGLLDDPQTDPENNSGTILWAKQDDSTFIFTSDVGTAALKYVQKYSIQNPTLMQIPHHGSRHNITRKLIEWFAPTYAFVSASGEDGHPRIAVVNAFKAGGAKVYSTHYPTGTPIRYHVGDVPPREGYSAATPLYEAKT